MGELLCFYSYLQRPDPSQQQTWFPRGAFSNRLIYSCHKIFIPDEVVKKSSSGIFFVKIIPSCWTRFSISLQRFRTITCYASGSEWQSTSTEWLFKNFRMTHFIPKNHCSKPNINPKIEMSLVISNPRDNFSHHAFITTAPKIPWQIRTLSNIYKKFTCRKQRQKHYKNYKIMWKIAKKC